MQAERSLSTGTRFDLFIDNHSPETVGFEATFPLGLTYDWNLFVFTVNTSFSSANVYPANELESRIVSLTDTQLAATYGMPDLPVGFTLGIELNLPTGAAQLTQREQIAEFGENHDLFEVDDFGEGFNIGLSVSAAKEFGVLSTSLSGRYQYNGEYDPTTDVADDELNPGDQFQVTGLLTWKTSDWLKVDASLAYSYFTEDQRNNDTIFQEGAKLAGGATARILTQAVRPLNIVAGIQMTSQSKDKVLGTNQTLRTEHANSNGLEMFGMLDVLYELSPRFALWSVADVRYYSESERQDVMPYRGVRKRYAFGPGFVYVPNRSLSVSGLAKMFVLTQEKDVRLLQDTSYQGVNLSVGVTYNF